MKLKNILLILLIVFGTIFVIGVISNYFMTQQLKKIGLTPKTNIPQIQPFPEGFPQLKELSKPEDFQKLLEQFLKSREITKKEFLSQDGKLKIEYTSEWIEIKPEDFEKFVSREELKEKYNLKTLFSAEKFGFGNVAILIIQEMSVPREKTFREILEEMKESNKKGGIKMEILNSEIKEKEATFEAKYENKYNSHSIEKIFFSEEETNKKSFLIAYLTLERDWPSLKEEGRKIISSAQLLK
jgi:hypothetical protein